MNDDDGFESKGFFLAEEDVFVIMGFHEVENSVFHCAVLPFQSGLEDYYNTRLGLLPASLSGGLLCLVGVSCCLLVSVVVHGFRWVSLSAFSSWLLIGALFRLRMASRAQSGTTSKLINQTD